MIVFYYPYLYTGGAETLIYRIASELQARKIPTKVLCSGCSDVMRKLFVEAGIPLVEQQDVFRSEVGRKDTVVVFSLMDYLKLTLLSLGKHVKIILYMVGLHTLTTQRLQRHPALFRLLKPCVSRWLARAIRQKRIIFMDRLGLNHTERFYQTDYRLRAEDLFPLPIAVYPLAEEFCQKTAHNRTPFSVLSISRADFPFKGYLKGLVEACTVLSKRYPIQLTIVSYGDDIGQLHQWIDTAEKAGYTDITLIGVTPYHELTKYILRSNLYIGMGTTVLDAAARGIPTIAVQSFTYELNANHLFWEEPDRIGGDPIEEMPPAIPLIERVISMSDKEYLSVMRKTESALHEMYSMDSFMEKFLPITNERRSKR